MNLNKIKSEQSLKVKHIETNKLFCNKLLIELIYRDITGSHSYTPLNISLNTIFNTCFFTHQLIILIFGFSTKVTCKFSADETRKKTYRIDLFSRFEKTNISL